MNNTKVFGLSEHHLTHASAELVIDFESEETAKQVYLALEPETQTVSSERAITKLRVDEGKLHLQINASDLTALRAAMNSFLAWISACTTTVDKIFASNDE